MKKLVKNIIVSVMFFASLMMLDIGFRVIYQKNNTSPLPFSASFWASFFWCVLIVGVSLILPRILRKIYIIAVTLVASILVVAHAVLDSFFGQYMSFSSIMFADDGAGYFEWQYFDISKKLIVCVLFCIILSVAAAILVPKYKLDRKYVIVALVTAAVGITGICLTVNATFNDDFGGIQWDSTKSHVDYYEEFSDYRMCMHMCGLYHYTFRDLYISTGLRDIVEMTYNRSRLDELDSYYADKQTDPDNEMTGTLKGKNLILIQLESIDSWMLNEIAMPTLSAIRSESINFTNFYSPKFLWAATFSAETAVNTGMITPMNSSKMAYFTDTAYPDSLPNLFREAGYSVNSFHRSGRAMYNRGEIHEAWGYEKYHTAADMKISDPDLDSNLIEAYDMFVSDGPFMSFIITLTGHGPYTADNEAVKRHESVIRPKLPEDAEEEYVWALCHAYETDLFIKALFEKLEADGRLEDTAVIFYTDHYDHYVTDETILPKYKGTDDTNLLGNVPFFIYSKDTQPRNVDKVIATYDILPTVVNLFDLPSDGRYYLGNDAFSDNGGYVIFRDMSWYDGNTYFNIKKDKATDLAEEINKEISLRLNACWDSIKFNYFENK